MLKINTIFASLMLMFIGSQSSYAHHSFAMFSNEALQVVGTVREFKFTNPHTFILLDVSNADGTKTTWNLEGSSPTGLFRSGWTSKSLAQGKIIKVEIHPLRSGAPGGSWDVKSITYEDGTPVVTR